MNDPTRTTLPAPVVAARIARWLLLPLSWLALQAQAVQIELTPPAGSVAFGDDVVVLPNGNIVVRDSQASIPAAGAGAVHLFAPDGTLISTLRGASANDSVGNFGIRVLANGHFVVGSRYFDNGAIENAGAVTWCHASTGCSGTVSAANSLIGTSAFQQLGQVIALANGHYLVASSGFDNGALVNVGAVIWCNGNSGRTGTLTAANALVGSSANDSIGSGAVLLLANGDAVIASPFWDNGAAINTGAVTRISGSGGLVGNVSAANSRVATTADSRIGSGGLVALANGHYVIVSHSFDNGADADVGAVTWCSGLSACIGAVTPANSLIGALPGDAVGSAGATALANGNYVVASGRVDIGGVTDAGAVTLVNGSAAFSGVVGAANSLHGSTAMDRVGEDRVSALANGNYVVRSTLWDNGAIVNAGASTFGNGSSGITGPVSVANSLVGSTANDNVGYAYMLANGNYVVYSQFWDNGAAADVGSVAWCSGTSGCSGAISAANALVGTSGSPIGARVLALANGNYVVGSPQWDNAASADVGAVTWASGTSGRVGTVSAANSMIGASAGDHLGSYLRELADGSFVATSPDFDLGATLDVGAVLRLPGHSASVGMLSGANTLRGSQAGDQFGASNVDALPDGRLVVQSEYFDNGAISEAGATALIPVGGLTGPVPAANQVIGLIADQGSAQYYGYDAVRGQIAVGHGPDNRVTLLRLPSDEAQLFANGFE